MRPSKTALNKFHKGPKKTKQNFTEQNESGWIEFLALNKIFYYMCDIEEHKSSKVFKVKYLGNRYIELFRCYRIEA